MTKFGYSDKTEDFIGGKGAVAGADDSQSRRVHGTQSRPIKLAHP